MEEYIISIIKDIYRRKVESKIAPTSALMSEIQNKMTADAKSALNRLCGAGLLVFHRTLNDVSFELNDKQIH